MKYFRSESFRKALRYQKRYLALKLKEYEVLEHPEGFSNMRVLSPRSRFKVAVLSVIAINRMKYLVRKYQRYLLKSSPRYQYKEKSGSSAKQIHHPIHLESSATSGLHGGRSDEFSADEMAGVSKNLSNEFSMPNTSAVSRRKDFGIDRASENDFKLSKGYESQPRSNRRNVSSIISEDNNAYPTNMNEIYMSEKPRKPIADSTRINYFPRGFSPREIQPMREQKDKTDTSKSRLPKNNIDIDNNNKWDENLSKGDMTLPIQSLRNYTKVTQYPQTRQRSFNSMKDFSYETTPYRNNDSAHRSPSPPKSYPRPKTNIHDEEDLVPTKLTNSSGGITKRHTSNKPAKPNDVLTENNSQKELKGYMQKLEDLQRKLKSQSTESRYR